MPGFFGAFGTECDSLPASELAVALDPLGKFRQTLWRGEHGLVVDAEHDGTAFSHVAGGWRGWFYGELPGIRRMPWQNLIRALTEHDDVLLASFNGWFAVLLVHEASGRIWAASDRRAQQPLFFYIRGNRVYISTAVSAFCRLPAPPAFDPGWLHETIYFNHPILDRSFLAGVSRVPPATILMWRPGDRTFATRTWSPPFGRPTELVREQQAAALERRTFLEVAADHFENDYVHTAVSLTAGFDSRAVLASAPRRGDLLAYTYGVPGCADLLGAAQAAEEIGLRHLSIELTEMFTNQLREHMVAAVRDSDGLERVIRAELLAAYPKIASIGRTVVISGVSGDHLFRDHIRGTGNVPALIPAAMMGHIQGLGDGLSSNGFPQLYGERYEGFRDHIRACLENLHLRHGDLNGPEGYHRYLVYENAPKYFGGEAALASNYLRFRTIYWDPRLVQLSFTSERGTLGLSERLPGKDRFLETVVQAGVIMAGPHYGGGRIGGVRARTWARGNRTLYRIENNANRGIRFIVNGLRRSKLPGPTPWSAWLAGPAHALCADLLGPDARLRYHLDGRFLDSFAPASDVQLAGRLLSAELVLRFIESRWPLDSPDGKAADHGVF